MQYVDLRMTRRESQILTLVGAGLGDKEIASKLGITYGTVKVYGSKLRTRLASVPRFRELLQSPTNQRVAMAFIAIGLGMAPAPEKVRLTSSLCPECRARVMCDLPVLEHECFQAIPTQGNGSPATSGHDGDPNKQKV